MDFIERILSISPDGGDGTLEALWVAMIVIAAAVWFGRKALSAWLGQRDADGTVS